MTQNGKKNKCICAKVNIDHKKALIAAKMHDNAEGEKNTLSSLFPSQKMMEYVEALIEAEKQKPQDTQAEETPSEGGTHYLSSIFPSQEMMDYVMAIIKRENQKHHDKQTESTPPERNIQER